ncbi:MAG TPA: FAD-dependent oxidoreductase [Dermatophilaceae bacterium]|nr:FAD-dependent oxidoreductase [Dermatophilaceae bacterium]
MTEELGAASHRPVWLEGTAGPEYPRLEGERSFDVAVVGGGITGLTTALLLARDGRSVCVLEQGSVASGTSGRTTAKVTSQHHLAYASLRATHGKEGAAAYGAAMEAAKEQVASFAAEGIDCDFRRRTSHVYATRASEVPILEREARAAREAGLPAALVDSAPLPFETLASLAFTDQVEIHPRTYLLGIAERVVAAGGEIFERTRAIHVDESDGCVVRTEHGSVRAGHVVVATLLPFLDRGGFFARAHPTRSYVLTAHVSGGLPDAMLISAGSPKRSIRSVPFEGGELLMVGGEGHHAGSPMAQPERYERLAEFARQHWDVVSISHRWSAQDYTPDDGVPYIGRLHLRTHRIHVATGLKKWGMTSGTLAGMLISDEIAGRSNAWAPLFSATRIKPLAEAPRFLVENARIGYRFVADRLLHPGRRDIGDLQPGEGGIVSANGEKVAGYRDDAGVLHAVSSRCTHLGCQVAWNAAERTWDCPCHGSRFDPDGDLLEGPARRPLEVKPTGEQP